MTAGPKKMEILAPAGDGEALRAAVFSGAHAVYLGLKQFSARRTAGNFTPEELAGATAFCHARNVKVYVAVNTTLWPGELAAAADCVRAAAEAGADALIVQDLAAAALARRMVPGLLLHGSTQMSVHSPAGVRQLAAMGFSRVVLARELSLAEVRAIAQDSPIELEVFVHGALCMSVSGQCYMSAFLGGRSGNRGGCAGPCRLPFAADGSGAAHLSLKDLCAVTSLPQLAGAGVASAKIEGRLRGPEYVAAAVHACGESLAGRPWDEALLRDVFSRSGFTNGYLAGRMDGSMFGVRTPEDTAASRAALPAVRGLYRRERQAVPVHFTAVCEAEGVKLTARDEAGNAAIVYGKETPLPAERDQRPAIQKALEKTGGTPFYAAGLQVEGEPGYLPGAVWNELRRAALEKLLQKREEPRPLPCAAPRL
ncbi:peptidase U32 family protein, partial [Allofournierella sp.]|uniref:peptidase U32 family protein n=1 Tax=Allofournierella sp. TaxID=1940256 RepID=UPI003AF13F6E